MMERDGANIRVGVGASVADMEVFGGVLRWCSGVWRWCSGLWRQAEVV